LPVRLCVFLVQSYGLRPRHLLELSLLSMNSIALIEFRYHRQLIILDRLVLVLNSAIRHLPYSLLVFLNVIHSSPYSTLLIASLV
jgi:hypothetical protein